MGHVSVRHAVVGRHAVTVRHALVARVVMSSEWPVGVRERRIALTSVVLVVARVIIKGCTITSAVVFIGTVAVIVL